MSNRTVLPLLLIHFGGFSAPGAYLKGRTRLMKLVFLSQMEASGAVEALTGSTQPYQFTKYLYGPFSSDLLRDLDSLHSKGLIEQNAIPMDQEGKVIQWQYKLTPNGWAHASRLVETKASQELQALVRRYGMSTTQELLKYVYTRYLRREPPPAELLHA